jgi:hypothetical protein
MKKGMRRLGTPNEYPHSLYKPGILYDIETAQSMANKMVPIPLSFQV